MTGRHYYHLNFRKINMLDRKNRPGIHYPYFSDSDQEVFGYLEEARDQGRGLLLITGRGWGKSYFTSTVAGYEYALVPASEVILSASIKKYVDLLWFKTMEGINSLPDQIRPTELIGRQDYLESGYKEKSGGKEVIKGYRSKIHKIIFDDDAGKTRGARPDVHVFEEIGSWSGSAKLIQCYNRSKASWFRGKVFTCLPILIGTGGEMESGGSEDAKKMYYDPDAYNLMSFTVPDEPDKPKTCLFIPAYVKFGGTYEETGISDQVEAKEFLEKRRESLKDNIENYNQEIQEFPFNAEEAFYLSGSTTFDTIKLNDQIARIRTSETLQKKVRKGHLDWVKEGSKIVGVKWREDPNGIFEILEHPRIDPLTGRPWTNLYISGCDSYDSFGAKDNTGEDTRSKGSIFMFKRFLDLKDTSDIFVAKCTLRDKDSNVFYEATAKLNMYYGAKMLYEHTKIGIMNYYETEKLVYMLYPTPKVAYGSVKRSRSNNKYGIPMPTKIKEYCIDEYAKYIKKHSEDMMFISQLEDAVGFQWGSSKHDETMAAAICIAGSNDMHDIKVRREMAKPRSVPVYTRTSTGVTEFN